MFGVDDIILGATVAGTATQIFGATQKAGDQRKLMAEQLKEEELRRHQMELNSLNERRQLIRNAQVAQSIGLSNEVNAGANYGSAAGGAKGQQQGQLGTALTSNWANLGIGEGIFNSNEAQARLKQRIGTDEGIFGLGSTIAGLGKPLGNMFGGPKEAPSRTPADTSGGGDFFGGNTELGVF
jgi:hypothetical protein